MRAFFSTPIPSHFAHFPTTAQAGLGLLMTTYSDAIKQSNSVLEKECFLICLIYCLSCLMGDISENYVRTSQVSYRLRNDPSWIISGVYFPKILLPNALQEPTDSPAILRNVIIFYLMDLVYYLTPS